MKLMHTKKIIIYALLMNYGISLYCIQKTTVYCATGALATTFIAVNSKIWPLIKNDVHPAMYGIASMLAVVGTYSYLYSYTPEGKLTQANVFIDQVLCHKLAKHSFNSDKTFFIAVHDIYLTHDLPLISAYNHLMSLLPIVRNSFILIRKALLESKKNGELRRQCKSSLLRTKIIFNNISCAIKRIREHKDYLPQLRIYKEFIAKDKKAVVPEQMIYVRP